MFDGCGKELAGFDGLRCGDFWHGEVVCCRECKKIAELSETVDDLRKQLADARAAPADGASSTPACGIAPITTPALTGCMARFLRAE